MLKLIADSGSTKTLWVLLKNGKEIFRSETKGINPFLLSKQEIEQIIRSEVSNEILHSAIDEIYFYGAGCSQPDRKLEIKNTLQKVFKQAKIEVEHDMLAACRALFGKENGIACILGTGSNSCLYVNESIIENLPSPGYILGDEGGGVHIGRLFLEAYIYNELPTNLKLKAEKELNLTYSEIVENVYKKPMPNRYMASFSKFVGDNSNHEFCRKLVENSFEVFIKRHILPYSYVQNYQVAFIGSIAEKFQDILKNCLAKHQLKISIILKDPMDGLIGFHGK
jgi:glucosamine kinase